MRQMLYKYETYNKQFVRVSFRQWGHDWFIFSKERWPELHVTVVQHCYSWALASRYCFCKDTRCLNFLQFFQEHGVRSNSASAIWPLDRLIVGSLIARLVLSHLFHRVELIADKPRFSTAMLYRQQRHLEKVGFDRESIDTNRPPYFGMCHNLWWGFPGCSSDELGNWLPGTWRIIPSSKGLVKLEVS